MNPKLKGKKAIITGGGAATFTVPQLSVLLPDAQNVLRKQWFVSDSNFDAHLDKRCR